MRNVVSILVALLLCSSVAPAQRLIELGIKAGTNTTAPGGLPNGVHGTAGFGYQVGGSLQVGLFDVVALVGELTYDRRTYHLHSSAREFDVATSSINVPILLRIGLPLKLMLELGPQYTHFLSTNNATTTDGEGFAVIGAVWKPFDLHIGVRYMRGLTSITTSLDNDITNSVTQIYLCYVL
jgi:hypothetical protein